MKKWFQIMLSVLVVTLMLSVPGMAIKAGTIATVDAKADKNQVTISGTVGDKVLAVSVLVYDEKGTTLVTMETVGVDSKKAFSDVLTLEDGTYLIKVADYDGGEFATATVTVKSSEDNTDKDNTDKDNTDKDNTDKDNTDKEDSKTDEVKNKLEITSGVKDSDITADLRTAGLDTEAKISEKLKAAVLEKNKDYKESQSALFEVKLMFSTDGGVTWVEATKDNFPAEGVKVTIPYPTGISMSDYDFVVAHMFSQTMIQGGVRYSAGEVEFPAVTKTADGIQITVKSLSPIMVSWNAVSNNNSGNNNGGNTSDNSSNSSNNSGNSNNSNTGNSSTSGTASTSDTTTATDSSASAVQTNDSNAVVIWGSILIAAVCVIGGVILIRRKRVHMNQ